MFFLPTIILENFERMLNSSCVVSDFNFSENPNKFWFITTITPKKGKNVGVLLTSNCTSNHRKWVS